MDTITPTPDPTTHRSRPPSARRTLESRLSPGCSSSAAHLLDQQLWCFGKDVDYPGNLLVAHGFERIPPPEEGTCPSIYRLRLPMSGRVLLRGFGVFYGEDGVGGVFVARRDFHPLLTPAADFSCLPWRTDSLPPLRSPEADEFAGWRYLTGVLAGWLGLYESWVQAEAGPKYREDAVGQWAERGRPVVPAADMSLAWRRVQRQVQRSSPRDPVHAG